MDMTQDDAARWWDAFTAAWAHQDVEGTLALFTGDATYRERWYAEPVAGREGLRAYWSAVARTTRGARPGHEVIAVVGNAVVARWWVTYELVEGGDRIALEGIAVVDHDEDGRARTWREWFDTAPGPGGVPAAGTSALPAR